MPATIPLTGSDLAGLLGEAFHTAFRKAIDSPEATPVHRAISNLPASDWKAVLEWVVWSFNESGVQFRRRPSPAEGTDLVLASIDPAIAVDRALNAAERTAFREFVLVGSYDGAQPADWLDEADNTDLYAEHIDPWWEKYADRHIAYLRYMYELPEPLTARLMATALRATFAIGDATLGGRRRTHIEIAAAACLWVRGYAEARGWTPPATEPDDVDAMLANLARLAETGGQYPEGNTHAGH